MQSLHQKLKAGLKPPNWVLWCSLFIHVQMNRLGFILSLVPVQIHVLPAFSRFCKLLFFCSRYLCPTESVSVSDTDHHSLLIRMKAETTRWALHTLRASHSSSEWHPLSVVAPVTEVSASGQYLSKGRFWNYIYNGLHKPC